MLAGLVLIIAGIGIQFTARSYARDAEAFRQYSLRRSRTTGMFGWQRRLIALRAAIGVKPGVVIGRLIGAVAIVGGIGLLATS